MIMRPVFTGFSNSIQRRAISARAHRISLRRRRVVGLVASACCHAALLITASHFFLPRQTRPSAPRLVCHQSDDGFLGDFEQGWGTSAQRPARVNDFAPSESAATADIPAFEIQRPSVENASRLPTLQDQRLAAFPAAVLPRWTNCSTGIRRGRPFSRHIVPCSGGHPDTQDRTR